MILYAYIISFFFGRKERDLCSVLLGKGISIILRIGLGLAMLTPLLYLHYTVEALKYLLNYWVLDSVGFLPSVSTSSSLNASGARFSASLMFFMVLACPMGKATST